MQRWYRGSRGACNRRTGTVEPRVRRPADPVGLDRPDPARHRPRRLLPGLRPVRPQDQQVELNGSTDEKQRGGGIKFILPPFFFGLLAGSYGLLSFRVEMPKGPQVGHQLMKLVSRKGTAPKPNTMARAP